jgi:hypothetical protein
MASDIAGFLASALVLMTFAVKDMRVLRLTGLVSNVAFIVYAGLNCLMPVLLLHVLLLPINAYRLMELARERVASRGPDIRPDRRGAGARGTGPWDG